MLIRDMLSRDFTRALLGLQNLTSSSDPPLAQVAQLDKKGTKLLAIVIRIDDTTDKTSVHLIARSRQQYINANISQTVLADQLN